MNKKELKNGVQKCAPKGITLIALVITIIVMLILVAVTIEMAVNGGLFDYAGKATSETQNAIDAEQELGSGKVTIGEKTYNSIDEYVNASEDNGVDLSLINIGDYVNYPVEYTNVGTWYWINEPRYTPPGYLTGWRVLSKEKDNQGKEYVRLVSAWVPLNYTEGASADKSVEDLTTKFLTIEINSSSKDDYKFYKCGFDISDSTNLGNVFHNAFTNKVQALTKEDLDQVVGKTIGDNVLVKDLDLEIGCKDFFALPINSSEYAVIFLASVSPTGGTLSTIDNQSYLTWDDSLDGYTHGIRPVVSLESNVKFKPATEKINDTTTWDIFM